MNYHILVKEEGRNTIYVINPGVAELLKDLIRHESVVTLEHKLDVGEDEHEFVGKVGNQSFTISYDDHYSQVNVLFLEFLIYQMHKGVLNEKVKRV